MALTKMTRRALLALSVSLFVLAAGCSSEPSTDANDDGSAANSGASQTLVVALDAEPTTLDVQTTADNGRDLAMWSVNETLVDFDPSGQLQPILAAELPVRVEGDPLRWRVNLRDDVTFTDGTPFDAEVVKYNVERILDPEFGSAFAPEFGALIGAEVVNEHTVDLITDAPDPLIDIRLRKLQIVSPEAVESDDYNANAVGTGPYIVESWDRGQNLVLVRNDDYYGEPKPTVERIEIRFLPDINTRIAALESGEIEIAVNVPPGRAEGLSVITSADPVETGMLLYDTSEFPYSEPDFRRALQHALDLETMNEQLFGGLYEVNRCQPSVSSAVGFNEELENYPYDPERARELLESVDLPEDFAVNLHGTAAVYPNDREFSESLAGYWRAVGLDVDTTLDEIDSHLDFIYGLQEQQGVGIVWADQSLGHSVRFLDIFVGEAGTAPIPTLAEGTYPELGPLMETARTSFDQAEQADALEQIWSTYCEDLVMGYTLNLRDVAGVSERVEYEPSVGKFEQIDFHRLTLTK